MHAKGLLHRDLKPKNIFINSIYPLRLILADFGVSYDFSGKANFQTKGFAGTNRFISNEMKDDEEYSFPLDVKVFGLVAHRVLNLFTGKEAIFKEDITQENF